MRDNKKFKTTPLSPETRSIIKPTYYQILEGVPWPLRMENLKIRTFFKIAKISIILCVYRSTKTYRSQNGEKSSYVLQKTSINFDKRQFMTNR